MQILIHSDKTIEGGDRMHAYYSTELETALARFDNKVTHAEVQLGDENKDKLDVADKRCTIEVHVAGMNNIAVTHFADTIEKAFHGATDKLKRVLSTTFEKMRNH